MRWHVVHCFLPCVIWKVHRWICEVALFGNLFLKSSNWSNDARIETKNISCAKYYRNVDCGWFKKFHSFCKQLEDYARTSRPKTVDSYAVLKAVETNTASSNQRVSGEFSISHCNVVRLCRGLCKSIWIFRIVPNNNKILQNFWLTIRHTHTHTHIYIYISKTVKLATVVEGDQKAHFSIATTPMCRGGR